MSRAVLDTGNSCLTPLGNLSRTRRRRETACSPLLNPAARRQTLRVRRQPAGRAMPAAPRTPSQTVRKPVAGIAAGNAQPGRGAQTANSHDAACERTDRPGSARNHAAPQAVPASRWNPSWKRVPQMRRDDGSASECDRRVRRRHHASGCSHHARRARAVQDRLPRADSRRPAGPRGRVVEPLGTSGSVLSTSQLRGSDQAVRVAFSSETNRSQPECAIFFSFRRLSRGALIARPAIHITPESPSAVRRRHPSGGSRVR